jgi:transposase
MQMKHEYTHNYPSDITREQFALVKDEMENARASTRPRDYDLYDVFCEILYIDKSGCQWRMLPSDFPPFGVVRYYYDIWAKKDEDGVSLLSRILKKISVNYTQKCWS